MERSLLWSALAVGVLGWLYCLLTAGARPSHEDSQREKLSSPRLYLAIALPFIVYFITLPESPPFGSGHGFGRGFLLGGIGALLALVVIRRSAFLLSSLLAPQFVALGVVALPLLLLRATIIDSLLGVACGWLAVTIVLLQAWSTPEGLSTPGRVAASVSGAGFAVTLCAVSALGIYRDFLTPEIARGTWSSLAVAFAAGAPVSVLLAGQIQGRILRRQAAWKALALSAFCVAAILLLLANLLALKIIAQPRFSLVVAVGLLAGLVTWWAARVENENGSDDERQNSLVPPAAFVILAAVIVSFAWLQGFGVGLMLLAAWPAAALAMEESGNRSTPQASGQLALRLLHCLLFGVILLLERLFEQRFRADLRGVAITDYYALLGFLVGAGLPSLLADWLRASSNRAVSSGLRLVFVGAAVVGVPAILMILWSVKTSFALLFGLALACLISRDAIKTISLNASLLAMAIALMLAQWTHRLLPLAELTRSERLRALGLLIIGLLILVIAADLCARFLNRRNRRIETIAS